MNNEKDSMAIHKLFYEFHHSDNLGLLKSKLVDYVATVRQEERAAERKRALGVIKRVPATAAGAGAFRKRLIEELYVEAAANDQKEPHGDQS